MPVVPVCVRASVCAADRVTECATVQFFHSLLRVNPGVWLVLLISKECLANFGKSLLIAFLLDSVYF